MAINKNDICLSPAEYLELEDSSTERHEYIAGRVFAMVGASDAHNKISGNFFHYLYEAVEDAGCHVYINDMKLWIESSQSFYYPDVMVTREPFDRDKKLKCAPSLVVEVLSPSTMDVDRREKLTAYRHISSLVEYALVYQDQRKLEVYRRAGNLWQCAEYSNEDSVLLVSLNPPLELSLDQIYRNTAL